MTSTQNRIARHPVLTLGAACLALMVGAGPVAAAETPRKAQRASPVASYLSGRLAQSEGDWSVASKHLMAALEHDPANQPLLRRTFQLALAQGDMKAALSLADRMQKAGALNFLAGTLLAADKLAKGRPTEARFHFALLPSDGIGQFVQPLLECWIRVAEDDVDGALQHLAGLSGTPGFAALHQLQAALINDMAGRDAEAAALYAQAMEQGAPLRLVQLVANFHLRHGRPEEAKQAYRRFLTAYPDSPIASESLLAIGKAVPKPLIADATAGLAEALFDIAAALQQENRQDLALAYGRISLHLKPAQPLARLLTGEALMARERPAEALAEFNAIARIPGAEPGTVWAARLRESDALRQLERTPDAIRLLETMAAEQPKRADALTRLGDLYRIAGRTDDAITTYSRAIDRLAQPGQGDWFLYYARALTFDAAKRWPEAEADLRRALELNPEQPHVLNYLGYSWVDRGVNIAEALPLIERAVALRPDDGYIVDSLGWARFKLGDYHVAIQHLERAVELRPFDATINDHLGDAYWAAGRKAEARFQWQRAANAAQDQGLRQSAELKLAKGLEPPRTAGTTE